jgi:hypothetical protein
MSYRPRSLSQDDAARMQKPSLTVVLKNGRSIVANALASAPTTPPRIVFPHLRILNLSFCTEITDAGLLILVERASKLHALKVCRACSECTDSVVCDVRRVVTRCCAVLCCAVLCCAVLCCAVLCCAVLCCGVLLGGMVWCVVSCRYAVACT